MDILFARELDSNYAVWWYSKNCYPDLGNKKISGVERETIFTKNDLICLVSNPTIADEYVFEIDIMMFHFNTLIVSEI